MLALLAEALLVLMVITIGTSLATRDDPAKVVDIVRFQAVNNQHDKQKQNEPQKSDDKRPPVFANPQPTPPKDITPDAPPPPLPQTKAEATPAPMIQLPSRGMASADISNLPRQPSAPSANRPMMGPVDTGPRISDTPRVSGSGPNGEPLYAAAWYREPTDEELAGYLSTASGPGWALIACRTAPGFRVEDCVKVDEYPTGSNMARAVLAAAWQFRVRPPRIGGQPKIGEWVRIRIDYEIRVFR